uniref:DDE Tnp4 domain-containing protein n=1 Tax=Oryza glaberrima TaxID=4538 RepID=I1Q392_ORYGL
MSANSQDQSNCSDTSIISGNLEDLMWEEINDPMEAEIEDQIEAEVEAQLEAELAGSSTWRGGYTRRYINRDHEEDHNRLFAKYFGNNPLYTDDQFRRRFRMRKHLFLHIVEALGVWSPYFQLRRDAFGKVGLSPLQKCTAAMRMLAYGTPADLMDESYGVAETTAIECLINFVQGVRLLFGQQYLRPTQEDIQRLLQFGEAHGFPGMLGSIDCMHWEWQNCPVAWKGQFTRGDYGVPTIMLEAVASADIWIWHAFFGAAGSNNDINVLDQSPLFTEVLQGRAPEVQFTVNGTNYNMGYYLADGIYPEWAAFVKSIKRPQNDKVKLFAQRQESAREDVERAFGVVQKRWAIIRHPARLWEREELADIMYACIILHNMIVEDERGAYDIPDDNTYEQGQFSAQMSELDHGPIYGFADILEKNAEIRDRATHRRLKQDLMDHMWQKFGGQQH